MIKVQENLLYDPNYNISISSIYFISGKLLGEYKRLQREENNENKSYLHHIPPSLAN